MSKTIKGALKFSSDASLDELKSFLEKARKKLSDEYDPHADEEEPTFDEGYREFDSDEESKREADEAARWLKENDPEKNNKQEEDEHEEDEVDGDENDEELDDYDEYGPDEDEESHQQDPGEDEEPEAQDDVRTETGTPEARSEGVVPEEGAQEAPAEKVGSGGSRFPQPTREQIAEMRQYTRPWESRARERQRLTAEAAKNPVLHHQGRVIEARQTAHADRQAAYEKFQQSPEYQNADPITQMEMDAKFHEDWMNQNPEHIKNAVRLHEMAHLHGLKAHEEHAGAKQENIAHVVGGGAQAEVPMSAEAALQHAGGTKTEEGTVGSTIKDPATAFADTNKQFLQERGKELESRAEKRKETFHGIANKFAKDVGEMPDYDRAEVMQVLGNHPALNDPKNKAKVERFFAQYHPLIGMTAKRVLTKLGLDAKRGNIDMGGLQEAGMHGLFQAINDYEHDNPSKASFATHASNKIHGLMLTHLRDQQKIAPELKSGAKKYNLQALVAAHGPEVNDRLKRIDTFRQVHQPKTPKVPTSEGGGEQQ